MCEPMSRVVSWPLTAIRLLSHTRLHFSPVDFCVSVLFFSHLCYTNETKGTQENTTIWRYLPCMMTQTKGSSNTDSSSTDNSPLHSKPPRTSTRTDNNTRHITPHHTATN